MPPLVLRGVVTKAGYMNKTATVTVSRFATHPRTLKVRTRSASGLSVEV